MGTIVVAPVGDNTPALYVGIREFPTEKIILLSTKQNMQHAREIKKDLERFRIPVVISEIGSNVWEDVFTRISQIKKAEGEKNVVVNVASGDRESQCAATAGAFVNGVKAFTVRDNNSMMLPVLKFSYYKLLTEKKMRILEAIDREKYCCSSLEHLSRVTNMSLPLISYHIHGTPKSEGLKDMGLVSIANKKGKIEITLSELGRLLIKGHVDVQFK